MFQGKVVVFQAKKTRMELQIFGILNTVKKCKHAFLKSLKMMININNNIIVITEVCFTEMNSILKVV